MLYQKCYYQSFLPPSNTTLLQKTHGLRRGYIVVKYIVVISISAGAVVVNKKTKKIVIVSQNGNSWSLPKGHLEKEETALEAATRETSEEAGLKNVKYIKKLGEYQRYRISKDGSGEDRSVKKTIIMFLFETDEEDLSPTDPRNPEAKWVEKEKVYDLLTHPKDKEFYNSIKDKLV